jgi:hypothetical protein
VVESEAIPRVDRHVALLGFGDCSREADPIDPLQLRRRDCRFERQVAQVLRNSVVFRRIATIDDLEQATDIVFVPLGTRLRFQRTVITAAKPFLWATMFTYLWTPLPYEQDIETYHLNIAVLDRTGARQARVMIDRQQMHYLGTYSSDRNLPADLVAEARSSEVRAGAIASCRGPHAGAVVHDLLRQLSETVRRLPSDARPPLR